MKIHVIDNIGLIAQIVEAFAADVAVYDDEIQALNAAEQQQPALIFLNLALRGLESAAYIRLLLSVSSSSNIVLIGENADDEAVFSCLLAGAKGYEERQPLPAYLDKLIRVVLDGEAWVSRKRVAGLLDAVRERLH